jgi:hypothetical protein
MSRLRDPERTFAREHETSLLTRMERGRMPTGIGGLVNWYIGAVAMELPDRLHKGEVWHDSVSASERESGVTPTGGSQLGSPALDGTFRALLEGSPSTIDEDGYYRFPVHAALSRMHRRWPLMARTLVWLAHREGDWCGLGKAYGWEQEMFEVYITEALRRLWMGCHDQTLRRVA